MAFGILMAVALVIVLATPLKESLSKDELRAQALALGSWAPVAILVFGAVGPSMLLPRWPVAFVSGFLYGAGWGSALGNIASALGAVLHFFIALHLLAPSAHEMCRKRNINIDRIPPNRAFLFIFLLRAFPFSSTVVTNLIAGALKVNLRTFFAATFLGMIPSTLMYAAAGAMTHETSRGVYLAITLSLCCFAAVCGFGRKTIRELKKGTSE